MNKYSYEGPVENIFGECVDRHFKSETCARSEQKARSNFTFQWKRQNNEPPSTKFILPGKIVFTGYKEEF